jgi:hypothetical protein
MFERARAFLLWRPIHRFPLHRSFADFWSRCLGFLNQLLADDAKRRLAEAAATLTWEPSCLGCRPQEFPINAASTARASAPLV